jgi:hypothetical protein
MKKASIELSINFLVVIIICVVMLGFGIKLLMDANKTAYELRKQVDTYNRGILKEILDDGSLVTIFPMSDKGAGGQPVDFDLGIRNELGHDQDFCVAIEPDQFTPGSADFQKLYVPGPYAVANTAETYIPLRLITPNNARKGSYLFNICVCAPAAASRCTSSECSCNSDAKYGLMQKVQVNVG